MSSMASSLADSIGIFFHSTTTILIAQKRFFLNYLPCNPASPCWLSPFMFYFPYFTSLSWPGPRPSDPPDLSSMTFS
jgi:hypothetical protein